jgi:hypothetical protein
MTVTTKAESNKRTFNTFGCIRLVLGASTILLPLLSNFSAIAQTKSVTTDLKINSEYQKKQSCPDKIRIFETPRPNQVASFATDGYANLNTIASNLTVAASYKSSVTWVGTLKPKYAKCSTSASEKEFKARFVKGKVYFTLNVGKQLDPNKQPLEVFEKGAKNGNPTWTWGGSD